MKTKLLSVLLLVTVIAALCCSNALAVSYGIGGYTANGGSSIRVIPADNLASPYNVTYGNVVGSGYTNFPASNCAVGVNTTMTYLKNGNTTLTKTASASDDGGSGGAFASASCSTGYGGLTSWYTPVSETSV